MEQKAQRLQHAERQKTKKWTERNSNIQLLSHNNNTHTLRRGLDVQKGFAGGGSTSDAGIKVIHYCCQAQYHMKLAIKRQKLWSDDIDIHAKMVP